jgi:hypothetical protein
MVKLQLRRQKERSTADDGRIPHGGRLLGSSHSALTIHQDATLVGHPGTSSMFQESLTYRIFLLLFYIFRLRVPNANCLCKMRVAIGHIIY